MQNNNFRLFFAVQFETELQTALANLPHLTLGRITHRPVVIEAEKYKADVTQLSVKEIVLLNSEKTERGQEYKVVERVGLRDI